MSQGAGIRTVPELRGRTVGLSQIGSTSHTFLRAVLAQENVAADQVNVLREIEQSDFFKELYR